MDDSRTWTCHSCGNVGLADGSDGFFYCLRCGSQADDIIDTGVADEDFVDKGGDTGGAIYLASHRRQRSHAIRAEPVSQYDSFYGSQSQMLKALGLEDETPHPQENRSEGVVKVDGDSDYGFQFNEAGCSVPADFGGSSAVGVPSFEDYHNEVRMRYVMGLQIMVELQCEALVTEFKVNPLICGMVAPIWLRFISGTGVFDDDWADKVIHESEMQQEGNKLELYCLFSHMYQYPTCGAVSYCGCVNTIPFHNIVSMRVFGLGLSQICQLMAI